MKVTFLESLFLFVSISVSPGENFLIRFTFHLTRKRYKPCVAVCDRQIMKGILH